MKKLLGDNNDEGKLLTTPPKEKSPRLFLAKDFDSRDLVKRSHLYYSTMSSINNKEKVKYDQMNTNRKFVYY